MGVVGETGLLISALMHTRQKKTRTDMMPSGRWSIVPEKGSDKVVGMFGHTAHIFKDQLHVFGGVDKDGNFSNTHAVLDLCMDCFSYSDILSNPPMDQIHTNL